MQQLDVITFGEAMAMFIADERKALHEVDRFTRELAGAETNVAIGLSRLGIKTGWVSKVGADSFGKFIVHRLQKEEVNINQVLVDSSYPTGFQLKSKVLSGDPMVEYFRRGSAASHLSVKDFNEDYFLSAKHLHMTGIPLAVSEHTRAFAIHALQFMKKNGKTVSFDTNLRPKLWKSRDEMIRLTNDIATQSDYVLPGIHEGEILTGFKDPKDIASFYLEHGVQIVVVKLGEKGAFYKTEREEGFVSAYEVEEIVDTVGAGDGFAVGLISGLLENLAIHESVQRGNAVGALAVQSPGDNDGYPKRDQLFQYMKKHFQGVN